MCLGAIGTQTGGSIIRPASFCGVAGMKPSYAQISTRGILPLAISLDHAGPIARSVGDLELLYRGLTNLSPAIIPVDASTDPGCTTPPTGLAAPGDFFDSNASDEARLAVGKVHDCLQGSGAPVRYRPLPQDFPNLLRSHRTILAAEAAATHGTPEELQRAYFTEELKEWFFPMQLFMLLEEGLRVPATQYIAAMLDRRPSEPLRLLSPSFETLVTPATVGPAPGTETTGDPMFNSPWSLLGVPAVSFPIGLSEDGLPLAVQLIGKAGADLELLRTARWCESVIRSRGGSSA
jgi:aspartyl-tRNA(Asn)/glutamyl-tRNA(Gln) amidotransferase subunit A